jgi:hypothetical protein
MYALREAFSRDRPVINLNLSSREGAHMNMFSYSFAKAYGNAKNITPSPLFVSNTPGIIAKCDDTKQFMNTQDIASHYHNRQSYHFRPLASNFSSNSVTISAQERLSSPFPIVLLSRNSAILGSLNRSP